MNRKDRDQIVIILATVAAICLAVVFVVATDIIPWWLLIGIVAVCQFVFVMPALCRDYYKINDSSAGFWRFIPLFNEIQMFSSGYAILAAVSTVFCIVVLLSSFVFTDLVGAIFGLKAGMFWSANCIVFFIICAVITNFIYAFGLCGVMRKVDMMSFDLLHIPSTKSDYIYYFLMMIPFIRLCSLFTLWDRVKILMMASSSNRGNTVFTRQEVKQ